MQYRMLIAIGAVIVSLFAHDAQAQEGLPSLPVIPTTVDDSMLFPRDNGTSPCVIPACYDGGDYDGDTLALSGYAYAAIFVWVRDANGQFSLQARLPNPEPIVLDPSSPGDPLEYDRAYGRPVSLRGDELAVASLAENRVTGITRPRVFLFRRYGTRWLLRQTIIPEAVGNFSRIVGLELDDGALAVKVANANPDGESFPSSVAVYRRWFGRYFREALLQLPAESGSGPGLGLDGRILAVGAVDHAPDGAVHIYERGPLRWRLLQTLTPQELPYHDFGTAVAVDGARIAVGAPDDRIPGPGDAGEMPGVVETYHRQGAQFALEQRLTRPADLNTPWTSRVGAVISLQGSRMLVGSTPGPPRSIGPMSILFERDESGWAPKYELGDGYGKKVVLNGDSAFILNEWFRGGARPGVYDLP